MSTGATAGGTVVDIVALIWVVILTAIRRIAITEFTTYVNSEMTYSIYGLICKILTSQIDLQ